jgi:2-keto-4-pentenoate hydratase
VVDSRYADYLGIPVLDRLADRMSNGGLIIGDAAPGAAAADLVNLRVTLICDGEVLVDRRGGHSRGDPMLPMLDFVHARQSSMAFRKGQIITAGTYTGLNFGRLGQNYQVRFEGIGQVRLTFQ